MANVIASKKWYKEAVELTQNFDFDLDIVYSNSFTTRQNPVHHCQFCGQRIVYVAVIKGRPKNTSASTPIERQIGCDCLERVLGDTWKHYHNAMSQYKTLVEEAKVRSRKEKYASIYKHYIDWLVSMPDWLLNKSFFLIDMKKILMTGSKVFTEKMEESLKRYQKDQRFNPTVAAVEHATVESQIKRMKALLEMIEAVDGKRIHDPMSAYHFVNSVLNNTIKYNGATQKQLDALNKVYLRYKKRSGYMVESKKVVVKNAVMIDINDPTIPW